MPRLARRSAGAEVQALAARMSDRLLDLENGTFHAIEVEFLAGLPAARQVIDRMWRRGLDLSLRDGRPVEQLLRLAGDVLDDVSELVADLLTDSGRIAAESIGDELLLCEKTLSARYAGVAAVAGEEAGSKLPGLVSAAADRFEQTTTEMLNLLRADGNEALRNALLMQETKDLLDRRLFATLPVRLPGHRGRGAWWRLHGAVTRMAREVEFQTVNGIRLVAMRTMNEALAAR